MKFGEGLFAWRNYRGFTQEELAVKSDVSSITISRIEIRPGADSTNVKEPSAKVRSKLARALGITPEQFYTLPRLMPEQEESLEDKFEGILSLYGSGKYTKEQITDQAL